MTDHNPLTALKGVKDYGGRLTRCMLLLQQFDYDMKYRPGKAHGNADALSCIPIVSIVQDICSLDTIRQAQHADDQLKLLISALESQQTLPGSLAPGLKQAFLLDGILCRKFGAANSTQMVIPKSLKSTVLEHVHNKSGHLGVTKTMGKVKEGFTGQVTKMRYGHGLAAVCNANNGTHLFHSHKPL